MEAIFLGASNFNKDIVSWDNSKVTDMGDLFYGAVAFNQDIGSWDTSSVVGMNGMFQEATLFNQDKELRYFLQGLVLSCNNFTYKTT